VLNADGTPRITSAPDSVGSENRVAQTMVIPVNRITFPGGDTKIITNFQYRIPLFGPVSLSFFTDLGLNMAWKRDQLEMTDQRLAELRSAFPSTEFPKEIQLASGTNSQWRASSGVELSVIMPIVNAPFRLYWAYNPLRLRTTINPTSLIDPSLFPNSRTFQSANELFASPRGYSEPPNTFKFTIGTTF
jgi:outer membrane protein insertion porin family